MNAKQEIIQHIGERDVKWVHVQFGDEFMTENPIIISGKLQHVLKLLDFQYDSGYGCQELFGNIWYEDGSWSERGEYDGSEWWEYKFCPEIPYHQTT